MHLPFMRRHVAAAFLGLLALASGLNAQDKSGDLAIIANKNFKLDDISNADLQHYFKAEKTKAPDGTKFVLVMHEPGRPERAAALSGIYKMSESEFTNYFVEATFTGAVSAAPKVFPSAAAVKKFVSDTRGAISYVRASDVDDSVKELKIDGKSPGESLYRLKIK